MNTLYYEIEGIESVSAICNEVEIPENVISLKAVRKKTEYFYNILQHLIEKLYGHKIL